MSSETIRDSWRSVNHFVTKTLAEDTQARRRQATHTPRPRMFATHTAHTDPPQPATGEPGCDALPSRQIYPPGIRSDADRERCLAPISLARPVLRWKRTPGCAIGG